MWISIKNLDQVIWLAGNLKWHGILIYSAWQGLKGKDYEGESIKNQPNLFLGEINLFFFDVIAL